MRQKELENKSENLKAQIMARAPIRSGEAIQELRARYADREQVSTLEQGGIPFQDPEIIVTRAKSMPTAGRVEADIKAQVHTLAARAGMPTPFPFGGTAAGYFYYPWAYPTPSGHFAFIVLTIIEAIGYIFCVKVMEEGSNKNSNGIVAGVVGAVTIGTIMIALFIGK